MQHAYFNPNKVTNHNWGKNNKTTESIIHSFLYNYNKPLITSPYILQLDNKCRLFKQTLYLPTARRYLSGLLSVANNKLNFSNKDWMMEKELEVTCLPGVVASAYSKDNACMHAVAMVDSSQTFMQQNVSTILCSFFLLHKKYRKFHQFWSATFKLET